MTRDEHLAKCIEAIKAAIPETAKEALFDWWSRKTTDWYLDEIATAAFDSLHGIARVCPVEATEEMHVLSGEIIDGPMISFIEYWHKMGAAGDLTDAPENKT